MSDSNSVVPPLESEPVSQSRPLNWFSGSLVFVALAALVGAHLSDRAKLIGLFPILWAAGVGFGLGWWAHECRLRPRVWQLTVTCLLLALGEATIVLEGWRVYSTELKREFVRDPSAGFMKQVERSAADSSNPDAIALRDQLLADMQRSRELRRRALSLPAYLQRRLRRLGAVPQPWPELFWAGEIVVGAACGTWVMMRSATIADSSEPLSSSVA